MKTFHQWVRLYSVEHRLPDGIEVASARNLDPNAKLWCYFEDNQKYYLIRNKDMHWVEFDPMEHLSDGFQLSWLAENQSIEAHTSASSDTSTLSLLGNQNTQYTYDYNPDVLETFENQHPDQNTVVSFDAYEFTSLCLTGDTMIDVACNETKYPNGIPIQDLVGTEGYVFAVDPTTLQPICKPYHDVRKTGDRVHVVKIVMDALHSDEHGNPIHELSYLKCTPDHLILVKQGFRESKWVAAKDLQPGMRLIATQRSIDTIRSISRHRLLGAQLFGEDMLHVHHKDHNHFNNEPTNLVNLSYSEHPHLHRSQDYGHDATLDVDTLVQLYESGENFNSLADLYNCDTSTITSRIRHLVDVGPQSESLQLKIDQRNHERDAEICDLYERGYLLSEIGDYFQLHPTRVSEIVKRGGVPIRESNFARYHRHSLDLPSLNHKVVAVIDAGYEDVYNMEVDDVHCFFANDVIVHNCPKTHQPDFAKVIISYIPDHRMVESKSLKLYLFSFRNHGAFHEDCINIIGKDLVKLMSPRYLEVRGIFAPRGGISIFPFFTYVNPEFEQFKELENQRKLDALRDASNRTVRYDM